MATYFVSDTHLGSTHAKNHEVEKRLCSFLDSISHDAERIYLMGDILDYWYEYKYVVPKGYIRFFGKLAELTDSGINVVWVKGNHDIWIYDYLPDELGVRIIENYSIEKIGDKNFFIAHGDGVGQWPRLTRLMRTIFHNKTCQKLYSTINPRWTIPMATSWSHESRESHNRKGTMESESKKGERILLDFCKQYSNHHPEVDFFVFGHLHNSVDCAINSHSRMIVIGDWLTSRCYGRYDGDKFRQDIFEI